MQCGALFIKSYFLPVFNLVLLLSLSLSRLLPTKTEYDFRKCISAQHGISKGFFLACTLGIRTREFKYRAQVPKTPGNRSMGTKIWIFEIIATTLTGTHKELC